MNRGKSIQIALILISMGLTCSRSSLANGDLDQILARMETAARAIKTVEADLSHEKRDMQIGGKEIYRGRIFLSHTSKCDNLRIDYSQPEGQIVWVVCNEITLYQKSVNQVIITTREAQASRKQEFSFIATPYKSISELKREYNIIHAGDEAVGSISTARLELTPKSKSSIRKLSLWVDQTSWVPIRYQVVEETGNITTFTLTGVKLNGSLAGSLFKPTWPKGTGVVRK